MRVAAAGRNLWIVGGGDLAGQCFDARSLDECILHVGSVTLGRGTPLFPRRVLSPTLRLTGARAIGEGMAELKDAIRYDAGTHDGR
jgi:dihydrofolate reductase